MGIYTKSNSPLNPRSMKSCTKSAWHSSDGMSRTMTVVLVSYTDDDDDDDDDECRILAGVGAMSMFELISKSLADDVYVKTGSE